MTIFFEIIEIQNISIHGGNDRIEGVDVSTNWKVISPDNLLHGRKKKWRCILSIDRSSRIDGKPIGFADRGEFERRNKR